MKLGLLVALLVACSAKKDAPPAPAPAPVAPAVVPADGQAVVPAVVVDAAAVAVDAAPGIGDRVVAPAHGHSRVMPDKVHRCPACDFACTKPGEQPIAKLDEHGCRPCGCEKIPVTP